MNVSNLYTLHSLGCKASCEGQYLSQETTSIGIHNNRVSRYRSALTADCIRN
ncbi:hypothetical protein GO730_00815 [Spirosoma sp. HMF3257]|uniref:hypothetical protein n=1 Tax=Spirosoma telluris TaxID=2183553 RepID=UPI0012FCE2A9|nr:hypothetical protein [Spirosoma telluris]